MKISPPPGVFQPAPPRIRLPVSQVITNFLETGEEPRIRLVDIAMVLEERAFGVLLILFSLPNLIPIPGLSTVCGLPIAWLGIQMALAFPAPWLPKKFAAVTVDRVLFRQLMDKVQPWMARIERRLRPRWQVFASRFVERVLGLFIFVLGITLALPIPLGNVPPGIAVTILALGLLEGDGAVVLLGIVFGLGALILALSMAVGVAGGLILAWRYMIGL